MNMFLWVLQGALAAVFLAAGIMKATQPKEKLAPNIPWFEDFTATSIRTIGLLELVAATGLVLPSALRIAPILTPLAATGLMITMVGAIVVHARRREPVRIGVNLLLAVMALIVAWGRFGDYSF